MKEQIYLAPSAKGSELIKSLAMHGVNCFNLRIIGAGELARMALMRSGISVSDDFVSPSEEMSIVSDAIVGEKYFEKATYSDIREIAKAIRRMRSLAAGDNECKRIEAALSKGIFKDKNEALISVYKKYIKAIKDKKRMDYISLIRKAISECDPIDADFYILKEYPLNPLDKALIDKLSGGKVNESSLSDLFGSDGQSIKISDYKNCYGAPNEVETVLNDIYRNKNLDKCTVAVTDIGTYGQLFFDYALLYDIPISFGCGIPIMNSNPARLLVLYHKWMTSGFFGGIALNDMLSSEAFDRAKLKELYPEPGEDFDLRTYRQVLSDIKLTNMVDVNKKRLDDFKEAVLEPEKKACIPFLEVLSAELCMPPEVFISKYSYIRMAKDNNAGRLLKDLDLRAKNTIYEELSVIRSSGVTVATEDMILNVVKMSISGGRSEEGKLYVTSIDGALSSIRDNLYIVGMSASKYPGSPRENYLLLDDDINLFGEDVSFMTSEGRIEQKSKRLTTLVELATELGSEINVSYAGLNVSDLKKDNASSMIFELYSKECGKAATSEELEKKITKVGYFEPAISVTGKIGNAYNEDMEILSHQIERDSKPLYLEDHLDREFSPSALEVYFTCERKFMLKYILGIPDPPDDHPFEVIASNESGTMAHSLMEELADSPMTSEEFLKLSEEYFDRFILEHPPLVPENIEKEKLDFLDMMADAYENDPHREVVLKEEDIHCVHEESGVKIHGFPDRVEKLDDGTCLIVDFKTGRNISHVQDDINTCLQVVVYAYLMEKMGYKVSGGEFRYIRLGETVTCAYDEDMKSQLYSLLLEFKLNMEEGKFSIPSDVIMGGDVEKALCGYCKYASICGKELFKGDNL